MSLDKLVPQRATSAYNTVLSRAGSQVKTNGATSAQGVAATPDAPLSEGARPGAIISLSPNARLLAQALAAAQATPDTRTDKVVAARARLATGAEDVNPQALAKSMLA